MWTNFVTLFCQDNSFWFLKKTNQTKKSNRNPHFFMFSLYYLSWFTTQCSDEYSLIEKDHWSMSGEVKSKKIIHTFFFFFAWRILLSLSKFQHMIYFLTFSERNLWRNYYRIKTALSNNICHLFGRNSLKFSYALAYIVIV